MSNTPTRPNIIFYFSDQQRADTLGCYGQPLEVTPNLDRLAASGTLFENCYTCQPVCGPARACLQAGRYATEIGCHRNALALPVDIDTIGKQFDAAGYETAYIGKWHLASSRGADKKKIPGEHFGGQPIPPERMGGYQRWFASDVLEFTSHGYDGFVFDETGRRHDFIGYRADAINNYAIHYLHTRDESRPFFMFVSQIEPHHQNDHGVFEGPDGSKERFRDFVPPADLRPGEGDWEANYPDYLGQCHSLDENVGRLVDTLKTLGLWENTILFYASDHGSHFRTRNKEYKRSCHDASLHVPLIATGGIFTGGGRRNETVSLLDVPVTLLAAAGIDHPEGFRGRPLTGLIDGSAGDWENAVFVQISESEIGRCIRTDRYTYCVRADGDGWALSCGDVYYEEYLYDNKTDAAQANNLVADPAYAAVRAMLAERLSAFMVEAGEKKPVILPVRAE